MMSSYLTDKKEDRDILRWKTRS